MNRKKASIEAAKKAAVTTEKDRKQLLKELLEQDRADKAAEKAAKLEKKRLDGEERKRLGEEVRKKMSEEQYKLVTTKKAVTSIVYAFVWVQSYIEKIFYARPSSF